MAARVFLHCILFTIGLLSGQTIGAARLELALGFARQPQDAVAVRGRPLTLHCEVASALPEHNVTWLRNDQPLDLGADSRRQLLANGSLYFKKVQYKRAGAHDSTDQGEYRCLARNAVGALVSRPAQLRVAVLAGNFNEVPTNTTAEAGDVVRFTCQIDSVPKALITWERNGKPLPQNSRMLTLDSGDLYLLDIQPTDEGTYRCSATNVVNKKHRDSPLAELTVIVRSHGDNSRPLEFLNPQVPLVQLQEGQSLSLPCAVVGPSSHELTWTFLAVNSSEAIILNQSAAAISVLNIHNVTQKNVGNYTCTASAPDMEIIKQVTEVHVWAPPSFKVNGTPISESHPSAKTVRFKCDAQGIPSPDVTWLKDGERLEMDGRIKQRASELVLLNAVTLDSGIYQCLVRNKAGEIWAAGRLQVNSSRFRPDPPQNPSCTTLSSSQIKVSWEPPVRLAGDKIVAYTVHAAATGEDEHQNVEVNQTFTFDKLNAYKNYSFYVRAYNGKSASDPSVRIVCQTGEAVPLAAPLFTVDTASPTAMRVMWTPLPKDMARGPITEYKIQWRRLGHPSSNVDEVKGDVLEYTITGLHPGKTYEVRVLAATKKGWPDLSDDKLVWKRIEMPSSGPQNVPDAPVVNLTAVNSSCIEVSWSLPEGNKYPAVNYKLFYRKQTSQQSGPIVLPGNTTAYILGGLEPQTLYEVHVVGVGESGDGELGVQSIHTRPDSSVLFLEPPVSLEAEPTSATSVNLTWSPSQSVLDVAHYNVSYSPVLARAGAVHYIHTPNTSIEIRNLKPYTLYEFKVRAHDHNNRHGPYSQKLECRTMEDIPSVVRDIQCKPINSSSVRVSWKEPAQINGVIKYYVVFYTENVALPMKKWKEHRVNGSFISTEITVLEPKTRYFLSVHAATQAGLGPTAGMPICNTPSAPTDHVEEPDTSVAPYTQHIGIMVGLIIGACCIVICMLTMLWRKHCSRSSSANQAESGLQHVNGNGYFRDWEQAPEERAQELELHVSSMATNIPPANQSLLDTKGGYPNGQVNGLKHSLLTNGRIPNGHAARNKCSMHITENPQVRPSFKCGEPPDQHGATLESKLDEEDSKAIPDHKIPLLLHHSHHSAINDTTGEAADGNDEDDDQGTACEEPSIADFTQLTQLDISGSSAD